MSGDDTIKKIELIQDLAAIADQLGWVIALPTEEDAVPGLIIGTEEFVNEVVKLYYGDAYEIFTKDPTTDGLVEIPPQNNGKKATVH